MEETQETSQEQQTQETSTWVQEIQDTKIVGRDGEELTPDTPEGETEEQGKMNEQEETGNESSKEGSEETEKSESYVVKIKVNGKEEEFDFSDEKQKAKAIEYMQKGRHTESIHEAKTEFEKQKELAEKEFNKLSYVYLRNVNEGKIQLEEPKRKDYFDTDGKYYAKFQYEEDAEKAYREAVDAYDITTRALNEFRTKASKSYESYKTTLTEFQAKHQDVTDIKQFIKDHVNPKIEPLLSMGAEPLPIDLLEAIYTHAYLDEIIKDAIERDRKKLSKGTPAKKEVSVKVEEKKPISPMFGNDVSNVKLRFR